MFSCYGQGEQPTDKENNQRSGCKVSLMRHLLPDLQAEESGANHPRERKKQLTSQFTEEVAQSTVSTGKFLEGTQDRDVWENRACKADQEVAQLRVRLEVQPRAGDGESSSRDKKCPSCPEIKREENSMRPTDLLLREQLAEPRPQEEHVRAIIRFSMSTWKNRPPQGSCEF